MAIHANPEYRTFLPEKPIAGCPLRPGCRVEVIRQEPRFYDRNGDQPPQMFLVTDDGKRAVLVYPNELSAE